MAKFYLIYLLMIAVVDLSPTSGFRYVDDEKLIPYSTIRMRRRLFAKRRLRNICNLENDEKNYEKLSEAIGKSDFVFTGKVVNYYADDRSDNFREFSKRETQKREKGKKSKKAKGNFARNKTRPLLQPATTGSASTSENSVEENSIDVNLSPEREKSETFVVEIKRVMKGASQLSGVEKVVIKVPKEFVSGLEITSDPRLNINCVEFHPVLKIRQTAILLAKKADGVDFMELTYFPVAMTLRHLDRVDAAVTGKITFFFCFLTSPCPPSSFFLHFTYV